VRVVRGVVVVVSSAHWYVDASSSVAMASYVLALAALRASSWCSTRGAYVGASVGGYVVRVYVLMYMSLPAYTWCTRGRATPSVGVICVV
jgi:hypothetical protein